MKKLEIVKGRQTQSHNVVEFRTIEQIAEATPALAADMKARGWAGDAFVKLPNGRRNYLAFWGEGADGVRLGEIVY